MPLPPTPPTSVTLYAAMRGPRVLFASQSRAAAGAIADDLGAKLSIGFFMPMQGVSLQRRAPTPSPALPPSKSKDVLTLKEAGALKGITEDGVRYAIKSKQLRGHLTEGGIGLGRSKLVVKRSDAESWEPSAGFRRVK